MVQFITSNSQYGKFIPNLKINGKGAPYGVVNERAVRAGAGIMLVLGFIGFSIAFFQGDFRFIKFLIVFFLIDFGLKVFKGPHLSPVSFIANKIVQKQQPDFVGAIQKRFAWSIGFTMAFIMTFVVVLFDMTGIVPLSFCFICLVFMWFETSFGICIGCKIYWTLISFGVLQEPEIAPACPGGVCPISSKK